MEKNTIALIACMGLIAVIFAHPPEARAENRWLAKAETNKTRKDVHGENKTVFTVNKQGKEVFKSKKSDIHLYYDKSIWVADNSKKGKAELRLNHADGMPKLLFMTSIKKNSVAILKKMYLQNLRRNSNYLKNHYTTKVKINGKTGYIIKYTMNAKDGYRFTYINCMLTARKKGSVQAIFLDLEESFDDYIDDIHELIGGIVPY